MTLWYRLMRSSKSLNKPHELPQVIQDLELTLDSRAVREHMIAPWLTYLDLQVRTWSMPLQLHSSTSSGNDMRSLRSRPQQTAEQVEPTAKEHGIDAPGPVRVPVLG